MRPSGARCVDLLRSILAILALAFAGGVFAETDERDAVIEDLRRRIEQLEKRFEEKPAPPPAPAPPPVAKPPAAAPKPAASEEAGREDEAARALERTLVRQGGLVLAPGAREFDPGLQYSYRSFEGLRIVTQGGIAQVAEQDVKRDELEASVGLRLGLPRDFQIEVRVPFVALREDVVSAGTLSERSSTAGAGDLELALTKQLSRERGSRPSLLASLHWRVPSGRHQLGELSPGGGFHQLQGGLTAVKRQDPLVFFGTLSYAAVLKRTRDAAEVDPGDAIGMKFGTLLAASPETSLRAGIELSRSRRTKINDAPAPGTETTLGMLELGLATLLSPRTLFDFQFGVGLTRDAPDFRIRLSLPTRF
jgi:hypothetical protein